MSGLSDFDVCEKEQRRGEGGKERGREQTLCNDVIAPVEERYKVTV